MRRLRLNREPLAELLPQDLAGVAGGGPPTYNCFISYGEPVCLPRTLQRACLIAQPIPTESC